MITRRSIAWGLGLFLLSAGIVWYFKSGAKPEPGASLAVEPIKSAQDVPATVCGSPVSAVKQPTLPAEHAEIAVSNQDDEGETDSEEAGDLTVRLVREWAESDAKAAAAWAEHLPPGGARQESINGVAIIWSNQDLDGAIRWTWQLPAGEERDGALASVAYEAARTEPATALALAAELPATPERDTLVQHAALQWAAGSPVEAALWARQLPDETLRERVLSNIATAWGEADPVVASQFAVLGLAPGRTQDDAVIGIVQRWVQKNPEAAAKWVSGFPEGALAETASENVLQLWPGEML